MDTNQQESKLDELAKIVVGAAYAVSNALGCGFLEKVYERALAIEIAKRGLKVEPQAAFPVFYNGHNVGEYQADLLVDRRLIVELKCVDTFHSEHLAQCLNYLRASKLKLALLINFQKPRVEWRRVIL